MHPPPSSSSPPSFTDEEECIVLQLHAMLGNNWDQIAAELPGRTAYEIMNFCNRKKRRLDYGNQESSFAPSISYSTTGVSTAATTLLDKSTGLSGNTSYDAFIAQLQETQPGSSWGMPACSLPSFAPSISYSTPTGVSTTATALLDQSKGLSGNTSYDAFKAQLQETQQGSSWGMPACSLPSFAPSISYSTTTGVSTDATTLLDQSTSLSGNTSYDAFKAQVAQMLKTQQRSNRGTPTCSIPPFDGTFDTNIDRFAPPAEQTQLQSPSPRSNTSYEALKAQLSETQQGSSWGTSECSLPPFDETFDTYIDRFAPTHVRTQRAPRSPRSNGYLEAIFYPPKASKGSNDDSLNPCNTEGDEQGEPSSTKKEDLNQSDLTNQDDLPDSGWEWTKTLFSDKD